MIQLWNGAVNKDGDFRTERQKIGDFGRERSEERGS